MMRYPKEHKQRTRQRILDAASCAFRERGVTGVSIPRIMGEVGLTHGDFYAHFESKDALVAEACAQPLLSAAGRVPNTAAKAAPGHELQAVVDSYLSPQHRDNAGTGCVIPCLAGEISREPSAVRESFTHALEEYLDQLSSLIPGPHGDESKDAAIAAVATMAGGILLARAVDDPALSDRILKSCRAFCSSAPTNRER
jgi:TetR/AcrR family transcriptional regulator, transcriptional repressor for nem operon